MDIYDVNAAVVDKDEVVLALFDQRYNTVMIITPVMNEESGKPEFRVSEPDGADRLYWLEKFGMITTEEFAMEAEKVSGETEKLKLFEKLRKDLKQ